MFAKDDNYRMERCETVREEGEEPYSFKNAKQWYGNNRKIKPVNSDDKL